MTGEAVTPINLSNQAEGAPAQSNGAAHANVPARAKRRGNLRPSKSTSRRITMTTAAQRKANKQNAQHSTGPRTDEGKQRTSQNALKHGFRAKDPLIPGEDPDHYYRHSAELESELQPAGPLEENLVDQLVDITWRLKRFARIEAAVVNELYDSAAEQAENQHKDGDQLLGKSLAHSNALNRLSRYEAQLARRYQNTMKELRELRKQRRGNGSFSGLASRPRTQPQAESSAAANTEPEASEPTRFAASPLESVAPMNAPTNTPDRQPDPNRQGDAGVPQTHLQNPPRTGNQEAAA